ncbi:SH3 domain [Carpediemonas membranifera]|uniref:SH3 domain n=1 Tax=Carpediemonas membranifera TaxID=201153 RepID=A0A8J6E0D8_9EUKA|nr:SH3 domain [Carpediemonas membranifera]|eukprot:KAG9394974.1 SH3 domain [Carpediemonas membranifera]
MASHTGPVATTQSDKKLERPIVVAIVDFKARLPHELSFEKGDLITLLEESDSGLWKGQLDGKRGVFPYSAVQPFDRFECASADVRANGSAEATILKSGWMGKYSNVHKTWRQRWVELTPVRIQYYHNDRETVPAHTLDVGAVTVQPSAMGESCMEISYKGRLYIFNAGSRPAFLMWLDAIREASRKQR